MRGRNIFTIFMAALVIMLGTVAPAWAQCRLCTQCGAGTSDREWFTDGTGTEDVVKNHLDAEFNALEIWTISVLFEDNILPAMMLMAEQLTVVAMNQVSIFGQFMDAKHQMESQRLLQTLMARAHKDYHPSIGMCEFGTATRSLAASERKGEIASLVLSQRSQDRQLGSTYTSAMYGMNMDKESRLKQYKETFCDPWDQNNAMWLLCRGKVEPDGDTGSALKRARFNKDIDYGRTIDSEWTLNLDLTDDEIKQDEADVFALASNLYANDIFARIPPAMLVDPTDGRPGTDLTDMQNAYLDVRSIVAKRSVAENSYNAIVGMKAAGTDGSRQYLEEMLKELGITADKDLKEYLGDPNKKGNPSYYAQMEILTKKLYQNPDFYTNLYDKPANVARKKVAMQAIGLMQKFDTFKSYLRSEASLSILLELAVMDLQDDVENDISEIDNTSAQDN